MVDQALNGLKLCRSCSAFKPLSGFYVHRRMPDGRQTQCKQCRQERRRAAREMTRLVQDTAERLMTRTSPETAQPELYEPHVGFRRYSSKRF